MSLACIESNLQSAMRPILENILVCNQGVTVSNGDYNLSYSMKARDSTIVNELFIKAINVTDRSMTVEVSGLSIY